MNSIRQMYSCAVYSLTLRSGTYPWVALLILLAVSLYQLISGNLLSLTWGTWVKRKARPAMYWTVLVLEMVAILVALYLGTL
jgi:hypothetical protein